MTTYYAHLLVISADRVKTAAVSNVLRELGLYDVTFTNSLVQAEVLLRARAYDLLLLDVDLAGDKEQIARMTTAERVVLPVLLFSTAAQRGLVSSYITQGVANDYILLPTNPALVKARVQPHIQRKFLEEQALSALEAFNEIEKIADDLRLVILPLGIALSTEKDFDRLLERIVIKAMAICNADVGALYLRTRENRLRIAIVRIDSLGVAYGGTTHLTLPYEEVPLYDALGEPHFENVAAYVALEGVTINIANIYDDSGFDFSDIEQFDQQYGYRSVSCLTVPLLNQEVIGVLQLINAKDPLTGDVQSFGAYQQLVAESLASQAAVALHNRNLSRQREALLRYKRDLQIGREIQAGFFPARLPQPPGWELKARFWAAREVAGDFYDAFTMPDGKIGLVVADVCDKGVVAALFMALVRSLLRAFIQQHYYMRTQYVSAGEKAAAEVDEEALAGVSDRAALLDAIRLTNEYIGSNHGETYMFATLFFGILDPETGELIYANCGHNPPVVVGDHEIKTRLMPTGPAVGIRPNPNFEVEQICLEPGDILLGYTDGITEARDPEKHLFGEARLLAVLVEAGDSADALLDAVEAAVREHTVSAEPYDDVAIFALHRMA